MVILRSRRRLRHLVMLLLLCGLSIWFTGEVRAEEAASHRNEKIKENGAYYYYNADGKRIINSWQKDPQTGVWNWYGKDGKQVFANWIKDGSTWYYIEANGDYARSRWQNGCYLQENGQMISSDWFWDDRYQSWYYLQKSGRYARNKEIRLDTGIYFMRSNGKMVYNQIYGGYAYDAYGKRVIDGWFWDTTTRQCQWRGTDGKQLFSSWVKDGEIWYYIEANGDYARSRWQDGCYLQDSGQMISSDWFWDDHHQSWYYLQKSGYYARNKEIRLDSGIYFMRSNGKMVFNQIYEGYAYDAYGKRVIDGWFWNDNSGYWQWQGSDGKQVYSTWVREAGDEWFYINAIGRITKSKWQKNYYLGADGRMVRSDWVWDDAAGRWYWVDQNGLYDAEVSKKRLMGTKTKVIFLDPGHGGYDPGASYGGVTEKDMVFSVYQKLKKRLESAGYTVVSSRNSDIYVDFITERSRLANASRADLFISLHFNAGGGRGIETFAYKADPDYVPRINQALHNDPNRIKYSNQLALALQTALIKGTKAYDRGVKYETLAVLRETALPAALVEMGYLDNAEERAKISKDSYRETLAECLYQGILQYYSQLK